ncbi:MAG TPA: DUF2332 domain-containing protein [Candidatus Cybelea sp.]|jgi:hypothetical protein
MRDVATDFEGLARACTAMGSPFTAALLREAVATYRSGDATIVASLDPLAKYERPGLHLAGALHYLALAGDSALARHYPSTGGDGDARAAWQAGREILTQTPERTAPLLAQIPQTNETARSLPLLAASLLLAAQYTRPLRVFEIGASAGLNLRFDRFRFEGADWAWGDPGSPLVLRNRITSGRPAALNARLEIAERRGCDLHPLDAGKEEDRLRLTSFIWADQRERLDRLRGALTVANAVPVRIDAESYVTWLPRECRPARGCVTAIVHTIVEEHFSLQEKAQFAAAVRQCGEHASSDAPVAHVAMELAEREYPTTVQSWPGDEDEVTICLSDGHAQDIVWQPLGCRGSPPASPPVSS